MGSDTTAPAPPQLGNFDIVSKIADGGMGTVYKAKNRSTGQIVAIKVIAPTTAKNPVLIKRFQRNSKPPSCSTIRTSFARWNITAAAPIHFW